jgi:hypothetical protein
MLAACENATNIEQLSDADFAIALSCQSAVVAAHTVMSFNCRSYRAGAANPSAGLSTSAEFSDPAAVQAFTNWARAHPEDWDTPFLIEVVLSFSETYPCEGLAPQ